MAKFTYGLVQDTSKLTDELWGRFMDDLEWFMQSTEDGYLRVKGNPGSQGKYKDDRFEWKLKGFKELMTDLCAEKPDEPLIQICDEIIRCRAENLSSEPDLLFYSGKYDKLKMEIKESNPMGTTDEAAKPIVIFLDRVLEKDVKKLFQDCNQGGKRLKGFYLNCLDSDNSDSDNENIVSDEHMSPVVFADHACVDIQNVNFRRIPLKSLIVGMNECDTLDKLSIGWCQSLPKEILTPMSRMKDLLELEIKNCRFSNELSAILVDQVKHMENLQIVSFKGSLLPTTDTLSLLRGLVKCPLRILDLCDIPLTGKVSELCKTQSVQLTYLEKLFLDGTKLNADDLTAMTGLAIGQNTPKLTHLSIMLVSFEPFSNVLRKFLKSIVEHLPECSVWMSLDGNIIAQLQTGEYECLRWPDASESYRSIFNYEYHGAIELESYIINACRCTYNYPSNILYYY